MKRTFGFILKFIFFEKLFAKKLFFNVLKKNLVDSKNILELGAGKNSYIKRLNIDIKSTAIDINENSLQIAKTNNIFNEYIRGDVRSILTYVKPKSFDVVASFDLLEHLTKEEGYKLICDMNKVAKKKIIIYTPNGFLFQPSFDNNPFQEHLSGWEFEEMKKLGFKVYGINGFYKLRREFALPVIRPFVLGTFISNLSWVFLKILNKEELSFSILCIKDI